MAGVGSGVLGAGLNGFVRCEPPVGQQQNLKSFPQAYILNTYNGLVAVFGEAVEL